MALSAGSRLGPYEILAVIGAGGMGEVYRARDTRLGRTVAVKVLLAAIAGSPDRRQRFEREARAVSSLSHPHICALYDVGQQDGIDFLVMEYLEGPTLAERLEKGPLPLDQVLRHGGEIADGLDKAHRAGIVHRDLKPANVMLTRSGVKLLDFGLAKLEDEPAGTIDTSSPTRSRYLSSEGTLAGTMPYMAPEQLEGRPADVRTDIWALGTVLYEMATAKRAFAGKSQASLIGSILKDEPPPMATLQPMTPPAFDRVVRTCLAKDPDQRWQSAHDVGAELKWLGEVGSQPAGVTAPAMTRRRGREWLAWGVAIAAVLAAAISLLFLRSHAAGAYPHVVRAFVPAPDGTTFAVTDDFAGPVQVSPDGSRIVFGAANAQGARRLWIRGVDASAAQPLAGTEGGSFPFWSRDGSSLGFFADGKLKRIDLAGGAPVTIADAPNGRGGSWNSEGVILFAADFSTGLSQVEASGGEPRMVTTIDAARHSTHRWPHFLQGGRRFLYLAANHDSSRRDENGIYVGSLDGGESRLLVRSHAGAIEAAGYLLFVRDGTLVAQPFDSGRLRSSGEPVSLAEKVTYDSGTWRAVFDASANGILAYQTGGGPAATQPTWFDRAGKPLGVPFDKGFYVDLRLSADGRRLAAAIGDTADIWIYDLARNVRTRFTFDPLNDVVPVWSPDGSRIAFASDRVGSRADQPLGPGRFNLFVKRSDGAGAEAQMVQAATTQEPSDRSPDGRFLAFVQGDPARRTRRDIWILPLSGDVKPYPYLETRFAERDARFSPDGRFIAYTSDESGREEVYVAAFPEPRAKWQVSPGGGNLPTWRRDGTELFYLAADNKMMAAQVDLHGQGFEVGAVKALFTTTARRQWSAFDVSADGQRFLVNAVGEEASSPFVLVVNWTAGLGRDPRPRDAR